MLIKMLEMSWICFTELSQQECLDRSRNPPQSSLVQTGTATNINNFPVCSWTPVDRSLICDYRSETDGDEAVRPCGG